jgi:hypothetical protein
MRPGAAATAAFLEASIGRRAYCPSKPTGSCQARARASDPPPRPPPNGLPGPYTYELCEDVDLMPDYENVLTD